jgi:hypothetical protein
LGSARLDNLFTPKLGSKLGLVKVSGFDQVVTEAEDDGDIVQLAKLKRLSWDLESIAFVDFFQELIPDGALSELKLYTPSFRADTVFSPVLNFLAPQCNITTVEIFGSLISEKFNWISHLKLEEISTNIDQSQHQELSTFLITQRNMKVVELVCWHNIECATLTQIIKSLSNIRILKLMLKSIGVESLHAIQQLRHLEDLELEVEGEDVSGIKDLELVELSSMKKLKLLLGHEDSYGPLLELSNESVSRLTQRFPKLREISLRNVEILNFIAILDNFRELETISYEFACEEEFHMPRFEPGNIYSKLKEISIEYLFENGHQYRVQDEDDWQIFSDLVRAMPNLEKLKIHIAIHSFNNGMFDLIESLPQLKILNV